jgi:hypothetical protein
MFPILIKHVVLNTKFHAQEAEIVAQAGRKGTVTIATNMAGRGTDILLGGNPEYIARQQTLGDEIAEKLPKSEAKFVDDEEFVYFYHLDNYYRVPRAEYERIFAAHKKVTDAERDEVVALGGLHIIATERREARRIDNQPPRPRRPAGRPRLVTITPANEVPGPSPNARLAERLIETTCLNQGIGPHQLTIHADRGAPMRSKLVAELFLDLGIEASHSRPRVSNDNPFSEAQFRTVKYRPTFPDRFGSLDDARTIVHDLFVWYNDAHHHSGLRYLTPADVHYGRAATILEVRHRTRLAAHAAHPERFVQGPPRLETLPDAVWINPPTRPTRGDAPGSTIVTPDDPRHGVIYRAATDVEPRSIVFVNRVESLQ